MVSKEKFVEYMNYIKELREREASFNEGLSKCFGKENVSDIFVYSDIETQLIKMLCDLMEIEYNSDDLYGDLIEYFIYELDFGKKGRDCIEWVEADQKYTANLTTPEELYDYILIENSKD